MCHFHLSILGLRYQITTGGASSDLFIYFLLQQTILCQPDGETRTVWGSSKIWWLYIRGKNWILSFVTLM